MKYVVFWVLVTYITTPCPLDQSDPYQPGTIIPSFCSVYHYDTKRDTLHKFFDTRSEAEGFVSGSKERYDVEIIWMDSTIVPNEISLDMDTFRPVDTSVLFELYTPSLRIDSTTGYIIINN